VIRATEDEKQYQISMLENLHKSKVEKAAAAIDGLQKAAIQNANMFEDMIEAAKHCSLGQITDALFEVGGQYRRNM
jgi:methylmalonyl-CoA mutase